MATSLAADLREDLRQAQADLRGPALALLARARDSSTYGLAERDRLLAEIVAAYRAGPRQVWAPVILDLLAPALVELLPLLRPEPPVVDKEEIRQQLVMEALRAAAVIPIHEGGSDTKVRVLARANKYVVRWLVREGSRQRRQLSFEALEQTR
jgi:hypothetical protein